MQLIEINVGLYDFRSKSALINVISLKLGSIKVKLSYWTLALPVIALTGCNSSSGDSSNPPTDSLSQISIISKPSELNVGESLTLEALATWESGKTQDISTTGSWAVTPMDAASLNGNVLTAIAAAETASLTLSYQGKSDTANFTIISEEEEVTLDSIQLSEAKPEMLIGETQSLKLTAFYSNNEQVDVTEKASWSSSDNSVAEVQLGTVSAQGVGSSAIQASFDSFSQAVSIEVLAPIPELESVAIRGGSDSVIDGYNVSFEAWALYSDESEEKITEKASWTSSDKNIATFDGNVLQSHSDGNTEITLTFEEKEAKQAFTVLPAVAESILPNISSNNTLQITEDDKLHNTVSVELSNGKTETFSDAEFVFNTSARDEQGYKMLEVDELYTRALRSGETEFELNNIPRLLQKRLDELHIDFELERDGETGSAQIALEVTDNPNVYQWNKHTHPQPENSKFVSTFTQGGNIYFIWDMEEGNISLGVAVSVFDGETLSEPVMVLENVKTQSRPHTYMINGGGNGYVVLNVEWANRDKASFIVNVNNLEAEPHKVDFSSASFDSLPYLHQRGMLAFNKQGHLILAYPDSNNAGLLPFHRYRPESSQWAEREFELPISRWRMGQQMVHSNHIMAIDTPLQEEPTFYFVELDGLEVEHSVQLHYPQTDKTDNCGSDPMLGVSLTNELDVFSVYCFGYEGMSGTALERYLWTAPQDYPHVYTPEQGASLTGHKGDHRPSVAHIGDKVVGSYGYVKNGNGSNSRHVDHVTEGGFSTQPFEMTKDGQVVNYAYTSSSYNQVIDSSHMAQRNPYVENETVYIHYDAISVWNEKEQKWYVDEKMFGTQYLSTFSQSGMGNRYLYNLNGDWHYVLQDSRNGGRVDFLSFQMRNPNKVD